MDAPTNRPNEPVTHGLPTGPGAGPEALGPIPNGDNNLEGSLRGLYAAYPSSDLAKLIAQVAARR
jgi:hypothetical protein